MAAVQHGEFAPALARAPAPRLAIAHDYMTALGGAERFLVSLSSLYPAAPIYTSLYEPASTFADFRARTVHTSKLNRSSLLRRNYRAALPLLPWAFGEMRVDADVVLCSSSGWSHGVSTTGAKIVYCHNPARWLYQRSEYVRDRKRYLAASTVARPMLVGWDRRAADSCVRYLANSSVVADRIAALYDREAEVLPPPTSFDPHGPHEPVKGLEPGYFLSVGRLLPYKRVDALVRAFAALGKRYRLVVAGDGPMRSGLQAEAGSNVTFVGKVSEGVLRWLYANCNGLLSAASEDFGLTPVEAAMSGKPCALLRDNGFVDTTIPGVTGLFFERPDAASIAAAVRELEGEAWSASQIVSAAERFSLQTFQRRLGEIIDEVASIRPVSVLPPRTTTDAAGFGLVGRAC